MAALCGWLSVSDFMNDVALNILLSFNIHVHTFPLYVHMSGISGSLDRHIFKFGSEYQVTF